ncbi:MAG: 2Fe-2S iron-sulfur cluster binding domain-containing protein [Bacteroidales bacterium]|nr:2Fe-2S iron-sulfur cluster binding domain-containing protein [Bacteroidales bacterium]
MGVRLEVNGRSIEAEKGETILSALNRHGMHVPTICSMKDLSPSGACRMCVVEVEGSENLVPSCSFPIEGPMKIMTHSPRVLRARKTNVELLLSNHPDDCLYCERNGSCELQSLSEDLNIRERRIPGKRSPHKIDKSSPAIIRDPSKCILCGRCVRICEEIMATSSLDFAHRGNELKISTTLAKPLNYSNCTSCGQCLVACPTGALIEHVQFPELEEHIHAPGKLVVAQYSPAVAVSVAELLGYKPGTDLSGIINAVLRRYGFDKVFETSFGADLMIMEQARIYQDRKRDGQDFPLITSSCPAWIHYAEQYYPELLPFLSPLKSPQQMAGALIREWFPKAEKEKGKEIVSVVISSCTAAKTEARRVEMTRAGIPVIDLVLTTRELARMIKLRGLDLELLEPELPDAPFYSTGSAGKLCGVAGGEAEATVRTIYAQITGTEMPASRLHRFRINKSYREMTVKTGKTEIRMGTVSGLANAVALIEELKAGKRKLDLLEIMACPDGCVNGGGQPIPAKEKLIRTRSKAVYDMDNGSKNHTAHGDPLVQEIYRDLLKEAGGKLSQDLFYTTYLKREVLL